MRAKPGELAARFDSRHTEQEQKLCRKLARWIADNLARLESCDPVMPDLAHNRLADNWRPLFAIAAIAGGDWPRRAAEAFAKLTAGVDLDAHGTGTMLLADIASIFEERKADRLPSARLAEALATIEGRQWAEFGKTRRPISANQLAIQLRKFGIEPHVIRVGSETPRGYDLADFKDVFDRFLAKYPLTECNSATTPENIEDSWVSRPQQGKSVLHPEKSVSPNNDGQCCGVADQNGEAAPVEEVDLL